MRHFPSSLPRVTKEDNRNLILLANISPIGVKMGLDAVPKALDGFSEMTRRHHDKGAPFEPLKYD